ncbi:hypothetical protein ABZT48_39625 [Streptomyces avermitilis]|uniref:hypothetical protein n=1 Tax=Streptomyces avermitilis TaxID=33903 RepID=UPI0033B823EC
MLILPDLRALIGGEAGRRRGREVEGLPLPPLRSGDALIDLAVGEIVTAPANSPLRTGDAASCIALMR